MKKREHLIFAHGRWEIATVESNPQTGKPQWIRRDSSWICYVGDEIARQDMPLKPKTK